jgi:hypothetical protein
MNGSRETGGESMAGDDLLAIVFPALIAATLVMRFFLVRVTPVNHPSVRLSKGELGQLKAIYHRDQRTHAKVRPTGRALYKKGMSTHWGLAVYENGMRGKFCLGKRGTYRFVTYDEVSGLFPVGYGQVLAASLLVLGGELGKKDLQVETVGGQTYVIQAVRHPLEKVVPVLQGAMGQRWLQAYRPDEVVERGIGGGSIYIHKIIRDERPKPFAAGMGLGGPELAVAAQAVGAPAGGAPAPSPQGFGALLVEESLADLKKRARTWVLAGLACSALGVASLALGLWLGGGLFASRTFAFGLMPWLLAVVFLAFGPLLLYGSRSNDPIRIFENGLEVTNPFTKKVFRYSWGEIAFAVQNPGARGAMYMFKPAAGGVPFGIPGNIQGLPEAMEKVRFKIGNPAYKVALHDNAGAFKRARKVEYALYGIVAGLGVILGWYMAAPLALFLPVGQEPFAPGLMVPLLVILFTAFAVARIRRREKFVPRGPDVRVPAAITAAFLALFLVSAALAGAAPQAGPEVHPVALEPRPAASALAPGLYENTSLDVAGSIWVRAGEVLEMRNVSLVMDLALDRQYGIFVDPGGDLAFTNVTVQARYNAANYTFEIQGGAVIRQSVIKGLWGDGASVDYNGGLEIYSSGVAIENSTIVGGDSNAVLIRDSDPVFEGNVVRGAGDDCIEVHNSSVAILNNTITQCAYAVYIEDGAPLVQGNLIQSNDHGVDIHGGKALVQGNRFVTNRNFAVRYFADRQAPTLGDNFFSGNQADVVTTTSQVDLIVPLAILVVAASAASFAFFAWVAAANRTKAEEVAAQGTPLPPGLQ